MHLYKYILLVIVVIGFFLRFFMLGSNPPALTWDEVAWGYNSYSIGIDGRDEFGRFFPITYLESFGDFKPPVYAYLGILPVKLFGLNEFSIRFPSALLGSLTVLLTYFLVKEIFPTLKKNREVALISSFLLAISPWHILLSRGAFEANVATFFIILGVYLFLRSTREILNAPLFFTSLLSFIIAMNTFNTSRVFLPMFVLVLFILKKKVLLLNWKKTLLVLIPAFVVSVPLLMFLMTPQAKLRFEEVNIFSDIKVIERTNLEMQNSDNSIISKVIHNRRLAYGVEFLQHYLDHFNPAFLFIKGDGNPKFSVQDVGQMYLWELPFLIIGAFLLFRKKEGNWIIIPFWIFLGIIPAATARETPHALRIETTLPAFQILVSFGVVYSGLFIFKRFKNIKVRALIFSIAALTVLVSFIYFLNTYFFHYPVAYAREWQYGYKEAVVFTESQKNNYTDIYFTEDLGRPYVYVLFYGNYTPSFFQQNSEVEREALGFVNVKKMGEYTFLKTMPELKEDALYVVTSGKEPPNVNILKTIYLPDGDPILTIYEK